MLTKDSTTIDIADLNKKSTITANVEQEYIVTTYDKVKLVLIEYENNKKLANEWWTYLGMALSFFLPIITAEFNEFWIFSAATLEALFLVLSFVFGGLTLVSIIRRIKNGKKITIEYCVNKIKSTKDTIPVQTID